MVDQHEARGLTGFRVAVAAVVFGLAAPQVLIVCRAAGLSAISGAVSALVISALAVVGVSHSVAARLSERTPRHRFLFALWWALSLLAVYRVGMMGVFMLDAEKTSYAINPPVRPLSDPELMKPFFLKHNCFTSYVVGGYLAGQGAENVYDPDQYRDTETPTPVHERIGDTHTIDTYQYPPPFLVLPRTLFAVTDDFFQMRTYWFALNVLVTVVTIGAIVLWVGGSGFNAYWLALPMVLVAPNLHGTLQIGNAHFFIVCLAALGMLAFETRREWLGAALLGFAIVSKIFPGVLLAYLLFRRRWSAVVRTGVVMVAFCLTTLAFYGDRPFRAFIDFQLPRLATGDAFSFARENARAMLNNLSAMGAVYKLHKLDLLMQLDPAQVADVVMKAFTIVLLVATAFAGVKHARRPFLRSGNQGDERERLMRARTWLALIVLGQLRNPFLPWGYGGLAVIWLIGLFAIPGGRLVPRGLLLAAGWLLFAYQVPWPVGPESIAPDLAVTLFAFCVTAILCASTVIRGGQTHLPVDPAAVSDNPSPAVPDSPAYG